MMRLAILNRLIPRTPNIGRETREFSEKSRSWKIAISRPCHLDPKISTREINP
jgi:hypothetical protein